MKDSASLLSSFEQCARRGHYGSTWEPQRLLAQEMVRRAVRHSLLASGKQEWGELAGSHVLQDAEDRGLDTDLHETYPTIIHHAALSDILVSAIRKPDDPPWLIPPDVQNWKSACLMSPDGSHLRRLVLVSHWNDERLDAEKRSWYSAGEIAAYDLPMQMIVLVIGQQRNGKRHSPWTRGFLHPSNKQLRFRKKERTTSEVFNSRWIQIAREDHAEISRETWLNSMLKDDVLPEVCFRVDLPVLPESQRTHIRDIAERKLERLGGMTELPEPNLSSCDWPIPCPFKRCCWSLPERAPAEKYGFIQIASAS